MAQVTKAAGASVPLDLVGVQQQDVADVEEIDHARLLRQAPEVFAVAAVDLVERCLELSVLPVCQSCIGKYSSCP